MTEYMVAHHDRLDIFEQLVDQHLRAGWMLQGGVSVLMTREWIARDLVREVREKPHFHQAMFRVVSDTTCTSDTGPAGHTAECNRGGKCTF